MSVQIKAVKSKREFRAFATFANKLYKGNSFYVPTMPLDDLAVFDKNKNAAYEFCEAEFFMAYKDGKAVGRIAAIINSKANAAWNVKQVDMAGYTSLMILRFLLHCLKPLLIGVGKEA